MTKSDKTYELEEIITLATWKIGTIGCAEVGLGDYGIVDFISMELGKNKTVRCYELKISKSDFLSDAKKTFIGEYNYYVIPIELWTDVKNYIEPGIGCITVETNGVAQIKRKAKPRKCPLSKSYIAIRILQALNRENLKHVERSWKERQEKRPFKDFFGHNLEIGDIVQYSQRRWKINNLMHNKSGTTLELLASITPVTGGDELIIKPSILRKEE